MMQFRNRSEAGQQLAKRLANYAQCPDLLVLALLWVAKSPSETKKQPFERVEY
jgi:hypothetical protein